MELIAILLLVASKEDRKVHMPDIPKRGLLVENRHYTHTHTRTQPTNKQLCDISEQLPNNSQ
jgi:hypothetical protein